MAGRLPSTGGLPRGERRAGAARRIRDGLCPPGRTSALATAFGAGLIGPAVTTRPVHPAALPFEAPAR